MKVFLILFWVYYLARFEFSTQNIFLILIGASGATPFAIWKKFVLEKVVSKALCWAEFIEEKCCVRKIISFPNKQTLQFVWTLKCFTNCHYRQVPHFPEENDSDLREKALLVKNASSFKKIINEIIRYINSLKIAKLKTIIWICNTYCWIPLSC